MIMIELFYISLVSDFKIFSEHISPAMEDSMDKYSSIFLGTWENYPRYTNFLKSLKAMYAISTIENTMMQ